MRCAAEIRARLSRRWVHGVAEDLRGLTLSEPLDLSGLTLCGVDFRGTHFGAGIKAGGAVFDGLGWFGGCRFADADFSDALFVNDARFEDTVFDTAPRLDRVEFRGIARFDAALMPGASARGLTCYGNASFAGARVGALDLSDSEFLGGFWAQSADFGVEARFTNTQTHGRLWLRGATRGTAPLSPEEFGLVFGYARR